MALYAVFKKVQDIRRVSDFFRFLRIVRTVEKREEEMPQPNVLFRDVGLCGRWELPSAPAEKVLRHLIEPGEPRVYVVESSDVDECGSLRYTASVTNSESRHGFATRVPVHHMVWDKLLELDPEATKRCRSNIRAYRISDLGREALVQADAYRALEDLLKREIPKKLSQLRKRYGVADT